FHDVSPSREPLHSFCQTRLPIRSSSASLNASAAEFRQKTKAAVTREDPVFIIVGPTKSKPTRFLKHHGFPKIRRTELRAPGQTAAGRQAGRICLRRGRTRPRAYLRTVQWPGRSGCRASLRLRSGSGKDGEVPAGV